MNNKQSKEVDLEITVIGCGISGIATAFQLSQKGYQVNLIDPNINSKITNLNPQNGTHASLGILMGNIYKRSKGRGFLLRNKSMKLWEEWITKINYFDSNLKFTKPLIKLATSDREFESMIDLTKAKKECGVELLNTNSINLWSSILEKKQIGGIISHQDGRIDPIHLMNSLMKVLNTKKINRIDDRVILIEKNNSSLHKKWKIYLERNEPIIQDFIVICSALNSQTLLKSLGHEIFLEPILGQVVELKLKQKNENWNKWPAVLNYQSINLIHHDPLHILIGATIEYGIEANIRLKNEMLKMNNLAPKWLQKAEISHEWSGQRARPINEPAPLLKEFEPGLLINTGHYRNGLLLAPACAEWISTQIQKSILSK